MGPTWSEPGEIARELIFGQPDADPLDIDFVDLHRVDLALPDFDGDFHAARETRLEAFVEAWHEQR